MITATVVYYTQGNYGPLQHTAGRQVFFTADELRSAVRNADSVLRRSGSGHIVLDRDSGLAVQVSGYSWSRGAYVDALPLDELAPYIQEVK